MTDTESARQQVVHIRNSVKGWLTEDEGVFLFNKAREARKPIVEIGSYHGLSALIMAAGSNAGNGVRIFTIDPHDATDRCAGGRKYVMEDGLQKMINLANYEYGWLVCPIVAHDSQVYKTFANNAFAFAFIDGDHEYDAVRSNINRWLHKVDIAGRMIFHDFQFPGVAQAVHNKKLKIIEEECVDSIVTTQAWSRWM